MRLVLSWLREFVDVTASADDVASTLALRGFEVASVEPLAGGDAVIDFEVTANRPDCLSVIGLARETATAFGLPPVGSTADAAAKVGLIPIQTGTSEHVRVFLDDEELCPRFAALAADVKNGPSPAWLAARLAAAGVRPISAIVDITNYVNIELGQPMHAYDHAKLSGGELRARRAKPGETMRTLDDVDRTLDPDMLVIADRERSHGVAGVMGGARSEVSNATTRIVFEAANFNPASVRRTSKKLGLKTEASSRFERGADIGAPVVAIQRAAALMQRLGAGSVLGPVVDQYPHPRSPLRLHLRRERFARVFGAPVADADVERILRGLGLAIAVTPDGWDVDAPTFRVDLLREADLIEEVGRHYGFDRLAPTFPAATSPAEPPDPRIARDQLVRRVLTAGGLSEAVTFGFIEAKAAHLFAGASATAPVAVANPLSGKFDTLRPLLLPGLVDAVAHNRRHGRRDVRLFEIGTRFVPAGETRGVAIAWTGSGSGTHWSGGVRDVDFFDAKGLAENLCEVLGVPMRVTPAREPFLVDGKAAAITAGDGTALGIVGQVTPAVADARGLPRQDAVFVAELDLDALERARVPASEGTTTLPRYPFVVRDLSIVVSGALPAEIIRGTIQSAARALAAPLVAVGFFDRYYGKGGKGVPEGSVSVSVRLTFQAADRTLTDAEIQETFDTILAALVKEHGAIQR
jgi:phenylalanyl-tRNA synthetase beta chain